MSEKQFSPNGSTHISELIRTAVENGSRTATVTGNWEIETEVRIPSDFTLILDGCHLKMADGVYSNLFVNQHHNTDIGRTVVGNSTMFLNGNIGSSSGMFTSRSSSS